MAEELEVARISGEITLNNEGLVEGAEESVKALQKLKEALTQNQREQKNSGLVIARASKELKALQRQIGENGEADEEQKKKIAELNNIMEQERSKIEQLKEEQKKLQQALSETSKSTEELGESNKKLGESFSAAKVAAGNLISDGLEKISSKLLEIGKDVIQTGQDFTASMSEVQAISGANVFELEKLREAARKFGSETVFSASDSAQALKYMALAGWDAEKSISALPGVLQAAAATGMSLGQASDLITDYLSAFNMEADQAIYMSDLLTYAQGNSNTSAEQLGEAWRNSAANLNAAGQDIETVTSMLEAMANQGKKGSEAGTMMSAIMRDLTDKMDNGKIKIGNTSIKVQDLSGNFRDLTDIMIDVEKATNKMGTAERAAALSSVFTAESINGINLILNEGMEAVSGYEEALRNSAGSASEAADIMNDNLSGDLKAMESALDELKLKFYDDAEQPVRNIVKLLNTDGVAALEGIINNLQTVIPIIVGAATAMGTLKLNLTIGKIVSELTHNTDALKKAFQGLTVATEGATAAQEGLNIAQSANVIGLIITAVVSLISAFGTLAAMTNSNADATDNANIKTKNYLETLQSLKEQEEDRITSVEAEAKTLKNLQDEYDNLRQQTSLTADEKSRLETVVESLAEKLGISTEALIDKDGAYKDLTQDIDTYIEKLKEQALLENAENGLKETYTAYENAKKAAQEYNSQVREQQEIVDDAKKHIDNLNDAWDKFLEENQNKLISPVQHDKELSEAQQELEKQEEILNQLKYTQAGYQTQMIQSTDSVIEYRKALGQAVDEEEVWNEVGKDMNMTADEAADSLKNNNQTITEGSAEAEKYTAELIEQAKALDQTSESVETAADKLTRLNRELIDNQDEIKKTKLEIEGIEKHIENVTKLKNKASQNNDESGLNLYNQALETLNELLDENKNKLSALQTEQTEIRGYIKEAKEEVQNLSDTISDGLDTVINTAQMIQKVQKEVDKNSKISLSTLNSIIKKYPELTNVVEDYINGVKNEQDIIKELTKAYDNAVDTHKYLAALNTHKEIVQKYKDLYNIDLTNYANTAAAKEEITEKLHRKMLEFQNEYDKLLADKNYQVIHNINRGQEDFQEYEYFKYDNTTSSWRKATQAEIDYYNKVQQDFYGAVDKYYDSKSDNFMKEIENIVTKVTGDLSGLITFDDGDSKKDIDKQNEERLNSYLKKINHLKALDQLSLQSEAASYQKILDEFTLTADQRMDIEEKLYDVKKKIREQEEDAQAEADKKQAEALQKEYDRIDRLAERGQLSTKQEIEQLEKVYQKYKLTTEQKIALEDKLYQKKQQLREEEISSLDNLGDAVVSALKNKYEQQKELEEKRIDESIKSWQKWEDETVSAIQGQIDALDELKSAHDEENKREEYENKRQALELQARYEKDDYNRKQIEKQIAALDKEESERLFSVQIDEQKKALQAEADNIKQISSENQEKLQSQKDSISEMYNELMSDIALQGEAQKFILESTQDQIVSLINSYAKDYEMLGQSLGKRLYAGMTGKVDDIITYIDAIANRTDTAGERTVAARKLDSYLSGTDSRQTAINHYTLSGSGIVSKIESVINGFADTINQISANATALKRQMAITANATADKYYEVQRQYYNNTNNTTTVSKPVTVNMTVNFNDKVDSPVEVRRQMEEVSQQLAKEIMNGW